MVWMRVFYSCISLWSVLTSSIYIYVENKEVCIEDVSVSVGLWLQ